MSAAAKPGAPASNADPRVMRAAMAALHKRVAMTRVERARFRRELAWGGSMNTQAVQAGVRQARELLGRASADWKKGADALPGPLHWPVAVNLARRRLREVLEALESERNPADALVGMSWSNGLTRTERRHWLDVAVSARPADAREAYETQRSYG